MTAATDFDAWFDARSDTQADTQAYARPYYAKKEFTWYAGLSLFLLD